MAGRIGFALKIAALFLVAGQASSAAVRRNNF